ncbi:hypothetical protein KC842_01690 [Candidatus Nomurabacteria bacterium]|nr:hypothetical protein [Candidatus Nomurabacteria bacterium]USN94501.1 MAG: hypothetical protein H6791_01920 [Candidatus Nomurabacteria bacterium]
MTKKIILLFVILILIVAVLAYTGSSKKNSGSGLSSTTAGEIDTLLSDYSGAVGEDFLVTLLNLQSIKLDDKIFSSNSFQSLQDFTITLVPDAGQGRPNPFAPIGYDEPVVLPGSELPEVETSTQTQTTVPTTTGGSSSGASSGSTTGPVAIPEGL